MTVASHRLLRNALAVAAGCAASSALAAGVIARDGVEVSILPTIGAAHADQSIVRVALDVEARSDAAARRLGFRSLRGVTDIDCRSGENQFVKAEAFDHADLRGQARGWPVLGDWGRPTATSYMFAVTERVCGKGAFEQTGPPPTVSVATGPATAGGEASTPAPTRLAAQASRSPAGGAPGPPPIHLVAHDGQIAPDASSTAASEPGEGTASPSAPAAMAVGASRPARPPASRIASAHPAAASAVRAPTVLVSAARGGGPLVVQISSSGSAADAQHALAVLRSMIAPPLAAAVESAEVGGARVYRATVTGFASSGDAREFCARAGVKSCWVRPPSSGGGAAGASRARPPTPPPTPTPTPLRGRFG